MDDIIKLKKAKKLIKINNKINEINTEINNKKQFNS